MQSFVILIPVCRIFKQCEGEYNLRYHSILAVSICLFAVSCSSSNKKDITDSEAIGFFKETISQKGASMVVRVVYDGQFCQYSSIRLRKIVDGKIDQKNYAEIYSGNDNYIVAGLSDKAIARTKWIFGKSDKWFFGEVTFDTVTAKLSNQTIVAAFSPIAPGDYILTGLTCKNGSGNSVSMGEKENNDIITLLFSSEKRPVLGFNFIHIDKNELVDAGVLNLRHTGGEIFPFGGERGMVEGSAVAPRFQDFLNSHFKDVAKQIKFTHFDIDKSLTSELAANEAKK